MKRRTLRAETWYGPELEMECLIPMGETELSSFRNDFHMQKN